MEFLVSCEPVSPLSSFISTSNLHLPLFGKPIVNKSLDYTIVMSDASGVCTRICFMKSNTVIHNAFPGLGKNF